MPVSFLNSGRSASRSPEDSVLVVVDIFSTLSWAMAVTGGGNNANTKSNSFMLPPDM